MVSLGMVGKSKSVTHLLFIRHLSTRNMQCVVLCIWWTLMSVIQFLAAVSSGKDKLVGLICFCAWCFRMPNILIPTWAVCKTAGKKTTSHTGMPVRSCSFTSSQNPVLLGNLVGMKAVEIQGCITDWHCVKISIFVMISRNYTLIVVQKSYFLCCEFGKLSMAISGDWPTSEVDPQSLFEELHVPAKQASWM